MTTARDSVSNRMTCLDDRRGRHSFVGTGLDVVPVESFPRAETYGTGEVLVTTRRCVWCKRHEARPYRAPGSWKVL